MKRLALGTALGGIAVYLYDPELGGERRERLASLWRENRDSAIRARGVASHASESARPLARHVTKAVGRSGRAFDRGRHMIGLPWLVGAAAIGGAAVYFLAPVKGAERRQRWLSFWHQSRASTLEAGRQAARQAAETVKPLGGSFGDQMADIVDGFKSKVS